MATEYPGKLVELAWSLIASPLGAMARLIRLGLCNPRARPEFVSLITPRPTEGGHEKHKRHLGSGFRTPVQLEIDLGDLTGGRPGPIRVWRPANLLSLQRWASIHGANPLLLLLLLLRNLCLGSLHGSLGTDR